MWHAWQLLLFSQDETGWPASSIKLYVGTSLLDEDATIVDGAAVRAVLAGLRGGKGGYVRPIAGFACLADVVINFPAVLVRCCDQAVRTLVSASQTSVPAAICTADGTVSLAFASLCAAFHHADRCAARLRHVNDEIRLRTWLSEEETEKRKKLGEQYRCVVVVGLLVVLEVLKACLAADGAGKLPARMVLRVGTSASLHGKAFACNWHRHRRCCRCGDCWYRYSLAWTPLLLLRVMSACL